MNRTITIKATGEVENVNLGSFNYIYVKSATAPFQISFDGTSYQTARQNDSISHPGGARVNFSAINGIASTVVIVYSVSPIGSQDTAQSNAGHYAFGNLGVADGAAAAGGLPQCDANGFLYITNNMGLVLSGVNNNHRRQIITLSVSPNSPAPLRVKDANGFGFMTITAGNDRAFVTDASLLLSGNGGTAWVTIGEIYLNQ